MSKTETQRKTVHSNIQLGERDVEYRCIGSESARKLRVRVGPNGIEVVQPPRKTTEEVEVFLRINEKWIVSQLDRIERFRQVRKPQPKPSGEIFYRGQPTRVKIKATVKHPQVNQVALEMGEIVIYRGYQAKSPPAKSLETWLRKQAREAIEAHLQVVTQKLRRSPGKVYIMGQRTKLGNCSALQNLSFNWRLILAPDYVLRYLVTHEAVHLAVPDHSRRFWLTVKSLCPETERAKQWLAANSHLLFVELSQICPG